MCYDVAISVQLKQMMDMKTGKKHVRFSDLYTAQSLKFRLYQIKIFHVPSS